MPDPLGAVASTVTLLDRLAAAARWLASRITQRQPSSELRIGQVRAHSGFELWPLSFDISLAGQLPIVNVSFYATNYTSRTLELVSGSVLQLYLSGGLVLESISLVAEYTLPPHSTRVVGFRRNLGDSEIRVISHSEDTAVTAGSVNIVARAQKASRHLKFGTVSALTIFGRVLGRPSQPRTAAAPALPVAVALTLDEEHVMRAFASNPSVTLDEHSESASDAGLNEVRYEEAVHRLIERKFLNRRPGSVSTGMFPQLLLMENGRAWLIARGLV